MPAVSFLKAAEYQDGHPGYSDPLDEQNFLVNTINQIEKSKYWSTTAIVVTYDDSDGWYDHQASPIVNGSHTAADAAICTAAPITLGDTPDRCGSGPRLPLRGHLALDQGQLRQPQPDRPGLGDQVHRGQLAARRADRQRLLRRQVAAAWTLRAACSSSSASRTSGRSSSARPRARSSAASNLASNTTRPRLHQAGSRRVVRLGRREAAVRSAELGWARRVRSMKP